MIVRLAALRAGTDDRPARRLLQPAARRAPADLRARAAAAAPRSPVVARDAGQPAQAVGGSGRDARAHRGGAEADARSAHRRHRIRGGDRGALHLRNHRLAEAPGAGRAFRLDHGRRQFAPISPLAALARRSPTSRRSSSSTARDRRCGRWPAAPASFWRAIVDRNPKRRAFARAAVRRRSCSCTGRAPAFPRRRCARPLFGAVDRLENLAGTDHLLLIGRDESAGRPRKDRDTDPDVRELRGAAPPQTRRSPGPRQRRNSSPERSSPAWRIPRPRTSSPSISKAKRRSPTS